MPAVHTERQDRLLAALSADDRQIAAALPIPEITERVHQPELPLIDLVETLMTAYADRPAIGERAPGQSRYETITYGALWARASALAAAWQAHVAVGNFVGILSAGSAAATVVDLAILRLGAVSVPLQTAATVANLIAIIAETGQEVLACSAAQLELAVECALAGASVRRVVVLDAHDADLDSARARLAGAGIALELLTDLIDSGGRLPEIPSYRAPVEANHIALLLYTSGSTGTPKGAIYTDKMVANLWLDFMPRYPGLPRIMLNYLPMSHVMGRASLYSVFSAGGTAYFAASTDMSTLFEDLALVRPTELFLVPRVCDALYQEYGNRRSRARDTQVTTEMRRGLLGGRLVWAASASAPVSEELATFMESLLGVPFHDVYGSTEAGCILQDGAVLRPFVTDVRLEDVPELGYFVADTPHPRGELLVKTEALFPGYYHRPDISAQVIDVNGYYHTGDIMARTGDDRYEYVDRRSNVLKLAQGEFVAVSRLEALFVASPLIEQIFVYGNSLRPYLLAVVVPAGEGDVLASIRQIAADGGLNPYEIPRDVIIEPERFSAANGLLSGVSKLARPQLKARYGEQLEQLYADLAAQETDELHGLRRAGRDLPVLEGVRRAARAVLNLTGTIALDERFLDIGGDSLSGLAFAKVLQEIYQVEIPVNLVTSPASTLRSVAERIETTIRLGATAPTAADVHGVGPATIRAADLRLKTFIDAAVLDAAREPAADVVHTVLLTGANGYLGRFLCLEWLERGAKVICVVRGADPAAARARLAAVFDSGDPHLPRRFERLAADRLEVLAGDISEASFGLDDATWERLAETVDAIVHSAALVNHVLPYEQLFGPNVTGTAEVIQLALTRRTKPVTFLSTVSVLTSDVTDADEDADIRATSPERMVSSGYASGYASSKWAGEVLLREAHEAYGLPVTVFRSDLILAHSRYAGQLNLSDLFTRLLASLAIAGIAPGSFYVGDSGRAHYDALPADFTAAAVTSLHAHDGYHTYNAFNPHDDGISLDTIVGWLAEADVPLTRIADYQEWVTRFEAKLRTFPDDRKHLSMLPLLKAVEQPAPAVPGAGLPTERFQAAVRAAGLRIPQLSAELIDKYLTDLRL